MGVGLGDWLDRFTFSLLDEHNLETLENPLILEPFLGGFHNKGDLFSGSSDYCGSLKEVVLRLWFDSSSNNDQAVWSNVT